MSSRKFRLLLCLLGGLLLFGLWALQANPYLNPADDSGRYMVLGESVARSGDLRLLNDVRHPLDTLYPPGLPMIVAFWLRLTGLGPGGVVLLVKATHIALLIACLPLLARLLERARLSRRYIALGVIGFALCPSFANIGNEVMAEAPFVFFSLASVSLVECATRSAKRKVRARPDSPPDSNAEPAPEPSTPRDELNLSSDLQLDTSRAEEVATTADVRPDKADESERDAQDKTQEEAGKTKGEEKDRRYERNANRQRGLALLCAGGAFLLRTAGISLLLSLVVAFWRRFGTKWGVAALLTLLIVAGGWQTRNRRIVFYHPKTHYDSYVDQFTLRDPGKLGAGRIPLNASGLWERASRGIPAYVGMIPRTLLTMMAPPRSFFLGLFYLLAVPMTLLILLGAAIAWRRGLTLVCGFSLLFWLFAAMWPWINPRFVLPLAPYFLLFLLLGVERIGKLAERQKGSREAIRILGTAGAVLLLTYWARVHAVLLREEGRRTLPNYTLGRTPQEGGFYAACAWLRTQGNPRDIVMGRPAYLLHLYSGHATTQIEPISPEHAQMHEVYVKARRVRYLVEDKWPWSHSDKYLGAYLARYAPERWTLVWQDAQGSGVRVWQRNPPVKIAPSPPLPASPVSSPVRSFSLLLSRPDTRAL